MTPHVKCEDCKHYIGMSEDKQRCFCKAFPDGNGIPEAIEFGEFDHVKPYPGDNGIMFEPSSKCKNEYDENNQLI